MTLAASPASVTRALAQATSAATLLVVVEAEVLLDEALDRARDPRLGEAVEALGAVALAPSTHAAVVSGRPLADLETATEWPEGIEVIGSHGLEWSSLFSIGLSGDASARLHSLARKVDRIAAAHAVLIERKPFSVSLHYRDVDPIVLAHMLEAVQQLVRNTDEIYLRSTGSRTDLSVAPLTNGWALEVLRQRLPAPVTTLYVGTGSDEAVISALEPQDVALLGSVTNDPRAVTSLLHAVVVPRGMG